ncbi:DUF6443 domain-containing protein [Chryseobacterium defluvii]|uniref:RHS repeat-associated protein n=1 Tax=Chryseobacterium defluvii TaxID=160396 RepID=A0A495SDP0_9FLAO|nr:DUF6443 domain-containing protein [Chryseobacterium defluvii]RKS98125.1 RHS repeat-associated protein [Chryseobacterium defluvii]
MKKIIIPIGALLVAGLAHAQTTPSSTENYVYTKTYLSDPTAGTPKTSETIQYFDGLGRPKQIVNVKASPQGKDVVSHVEYDGFGRQVKDYLPVPQSGTQNGAIYTSPLGNASTIYGGEKIYAEKILENSPLDRPLQQIQVGNEWTNKPVNFEYGTNIENDNIKRYETVTTWNATDKVYISTIQQSENFPIGQLYKNSITDEDGNKTIEFKNGGGQTLLVRKVISATENADTYYVYNEYSQLAYVIPPLASIGTIDQTVLDNFCYRYKYDSKNRLVEKKLPGKGWEYLLYDKQDRLVATQDAKLRENGLWLYTKYDQFGRVAITGISIGSSRISEQNEVDGLGSNNLNRINYVFFNRQGMDVYYDNPDITYPNSTKWVTLLSLNYYDTYPAYSFNPSFPATIYGKQTLTDNPASTGKSTKSLPVMTFVKNIEDNNWTKNYNYYDTKGRTIGTHSINYLGGYTKTESDLDLAGAVQQTKTYHKRLSTDAEKVITETFEYDSQNRLKKHYHQVDSLPQELLADNTYNELSQLINKQVGNNLQSIDYAYNIRGWMTKINDPGNLNGALFGYEIKYNNPENTSLASPRYNGNISEVSWRVSNTDVFKRYSYNYDSLNRLKEAIFSNPDASVPETHFNDEKIDYDLNGNIVHLERKAKSLNGSSTELIDYLNYEYHANKLNLIIDESQNPTGYEGGGNFIDYDVNGNMTSMMDKNISAIGYNYQNLPNVITTADNNKKIYHTYRADGTKLRKIYNISYPQDGTYFATVTEYLDGFHYLTTQGVYKSDFNALDYAYEQEAFMKEINLSPDTELQFVPTAEGFYDFAKNEYIYQYKDHLGNVRVSFRNKDGDPIITDQNDYYPFGMNIPREEQAVFGTASLYNYKYNGKELQETGMYDYGARMYMPDIGRWGVLDPLAELQSRFSPYHYSYNNPIFYNDPTGMIGDCPTCPKGITNINLLPNGEKEMQIEEVLLTGTKKSSFNYSAAFQLMLPSSSLTGVLPAVNSPSILSYFPSITWPSNAVVLETATAAEATLLADDVTGVGVADDILIPVIFAGSVIYVIINSDLDKGNVSIDSQESFDTYKPDDSGIVRPLDATIPLEKRMDNFARKRKGSQKWGEEAEHKKGARPSKKGTHQKGQTRKGRDKGGEKGDDRRPYRRK